MRTLKLSFIEFLQTGRLGPLGCECKKADVANALGKPEKAKNVEDYPDGASLWCYFPIEIRFFGEQISQLGIGFTWWDGKLPDGVEFRDFFPDKHTKMATIHDILKESQIQYEVGNDGRMLRTSAGVWIFPTTEQEDTIMSAVKQCRGPKAFFDDHFRSSKET
jgi:hypothetical protein